MRDINWYAIGRPVSTLVGLRALRSGGMPSVARVNISAMKRRAFSAVAPSIDCCQREPRLYSEIYSKLICITVVELGAPLSRFLERAAGRK